MKYQGHEFGEVFNNIELLSAFVDEYNAKFSARETPCNTCGGTMYNLWLRFFGVKSGQGEPLQACKYKFKGNPIITIGGNKDVSSRNLTDELAEMIWDENPTFRGYFDDKSQQMLASREASLTVGVEPKPKRKKRTAKAK